MPPIAYALASDTLNGVVRAWAMTRRPDLAGPGTGDTATPLAAVGGLILGLLRLSVAPILTLPGFRAQLLEEPHRPRPPLTPAPAPRVAPSPRLAQVLRPTRRPGS